MIRTIHNQIKDYHIVAQGIIWFVLWVIAVCSGTIIAALLLEIFYQLAA